MAYTTFNEMKKADRVKAFAKLRLEAILYILENPSIDLVAILSDLRRGICPDQTQPP